MAEPHIICGLRDRRAELASMVNRLEQQLVQHRASLMHLDATMRLFDPDIRPEEIRPRQLRAHNDWFRPGECQANRVPEVTEKSLWQALQRQRGWPFDRRHA